MVNIIFKIICIAHFIFLLEALAQKADLRLTGWVSCLLDFAHSCTLLYVASPGLMEKHLSHRVGARVRKTF